MMKKYVTCALAFVLCMVMLAACSPASPKNTEDKGVAFVSVYVEDEDRFILEDVPVTLNEGDTAFEILKRVTRKEKLHMEFEGNAENAYVVGIDNLYSLDKGENSGWMFYVNGEMATVGPGGFEASNGDKIEWIYVTDWTLKE